MSQKYIIGNWKLNPKNEKEAITIFTKIKKDLSLLKYKVIICPPSIFVPALSKIKTTNIILGLQNTALEDTGAYTGQVSVGTVLSYKVKYCIIGHSEARANGDTDERVAKKIAYVVKNNITPILCVGERERDEAHTYFAFIENQIKSALTGISKKSIEGMIIAYEPIWAIGKDAVRDATPEEFYEIKILIKKVLKESFGVSLVPILYGGSATPKNAESFMTAGHADGLLIGRASLDPKSLQSISSIAKSMK